MDVLIVHSLNSLDLACCAGPYFQSFVSYGVASGCPEGGCVCCLTLCFLRLDLLLLLQTLGHCLTGSLVNIVLVQFGLLASPGIPSLVGMTWGVFLPCLVCVPC